jgi:hypothetical protein
MKLSADSPRQKPPVVMARNHFVILFAGVAGVVSMTRHPVKLNQIFAKLRLTLKRVEAKLHRARYTP